MTKKNTDILFTLGESLVRQKDWPDYLAMGITHADVPALLDLVAEKTLYSADSQDSEDNESWASLHAWRALGQLKSPDAIEPLITFFSQDSDDDWALTEFPQVFGMIGEAAIVPLVGCMNNAEFDEYTRIMSMDGLTEIASHHPSLRNEILRHYQCYLRQPDESLLGLNGLLVGQLLKLNAKELIDDIRQLFARNCVDFSCAGDLEEVEIELGFRSNRSTPKPNFMNHLHDAPLPRPKDDDDVLAMLEYYLDRYGQDESILDVSELDGFFAALGCSPENISPGIWMLTIWGGETHCPDWKNKKEIKEFTQLIFSFYNHVMGEMNEGTYEALFLHRKLEGKSYLIVDEWCAGFLRGVDLWETLTPVDAVVLEKALQPINLFATDEGADQQIPLSDSEIESQQKLIKPRVIELFQHFLKQRRPEQAPIVRDNDNPKTKRNELCPCGSGKKFKKCCLH